MMHTLQIRLLGTFQMTLGAEIVETPQHSRVRELIAYLVLREGEPQPRQHLAFTFWPDSTESQARTNLRHAVHGLRRLLPYAEDYVRITRDVIEWRHESDYTLDVAEFTQLLQQAERDALDADALMAAVDLYGGELLPGCYEDWALAQRRELETAALNALQKLVTLLENRGQYAQAIPYAKWLVSMDPLRESSCLQLMRLHALEGQRADALRVYHACVKALQNELNVEPGAELTRAYRSIRDSGGEKAALHSTHRTAYGDLDLPDLPALVGRDREWSALRAAWERSLQGSAHMVVIAGEAGQGKTRLADEIYRWAGHSGSVTARTRSFASHSDLVYAPVAELLRQDAFAGRIADLDEMWRLELARLLPELVDNGQSMSVPRAITEPWELQRYLQALTRVVTVESLPHLLLFDDLQWCDRETLQWLQYLIHERPQSQLLIVGTVRSEEVDDRHAYAALARNLTHDDRFTEIRVGPLNKAATLSLAEQMAGEELSPQQAETIWQDTGGNPLFIVETVRHWTDRYETSAAHTASLLGMPDSDALRLPPKVYAVVASRLAQVSVASRSVVSLAATAGRSFSYAVLAAATDVADEVLVDCLDELLQRRIVVERGDEFDFSHDRIRDVAYAETGHARRRLLHARIAAAIETVHAGSLNEVSSQLAHHHEHAGNLAEAVKYLRRAGERVAGQFAHEEAIHYYTRALNLLPETDVEQRIELLLLCEAVYASQGDVENRRESLMELRQLATKLGGNATELALSRARIEMRWVAFVGFQGENEEAVRLAEEIIVLAKAAGAPEIEMECYWHWGRELWALGDFDEARTRLWQGMEIAESLGETDAAADILTYIVAAGYWAGEPADRVLDGLTQCLDMYESTGNLRGMTDIHNRLGFFYTHDKEDLVAAKRHYDEALRITDRTGDYWRDVVEGNLGFFHICAGDYVESDRLLRHSIRTARERGHRFLLGVQTAYVAYGAINRGDLDSAERSLEESVRLHQTVGSKQYLGLTFIYAGLCQLYAGNPVSAESNARRATEITHAISDVRREADAYVCLGHALAELKRLDEAIEVYSTALSMHRELNHPRRSLEALAGLAAVHEQQEEEEQASLILEEIMRDLHANEAVATEEAFRVYLTCYRLLSTRQDPRADNVLTLAHDQLQRRAASLNDPAKLQLFRDMQGHAEIEASWQRLHPA